MLIIYIIIIFNINKISSLLYTGGQISTIHWKNINPIKAILLFSIVEFHFDRKNFALDLMHTITTNDRKALDAFIARLSAWSYESANILLAKRETWINTVQFCTSRSEDCYNFLRNSLFSLCIKSFCEISRGESMNKI